MKRNFNEDYADLIGVVRILFEDCAVSFITSFLHLICEIRVIRGNLSVRN